ncbi:unnamed protein product [Toxocara canis]|uniref:Secreted protein n=1 Tax=Toxocara canis TaxID=6265 RepID=A0A183U3D8_TOXCA|nr:unnamed protein product [Toxocara canis]
MTTRASARDAEGTIVIFAIGCMQADISSRFAKQPLQFEDAICNQRSTSNYYCQKRPSTQPTGRMEPCVVAVCMCGSDVSAGGRLGWVPLVPLVLCVPDSAP